MTSRRSFLQIAAAGALAPLAGSLGCAGAQTGARAAGGGPLPHPEGGTLGLELYSVRQHLQKDVPKTLAMVRGWGFEHVEMAGLYGLTAADFRAALDREGLRTASMLDSYERLRDDMPSVVKDAKALGVEYVLTAWIPHQGLFSRADTERAIADFTRWGQALRQEGLRFGYHVHGYEFQPGPDGTLMDLLLAKTPPDLVVYEMDVFWVLHGGGSPVDYLRRYPGRFELMHLKDMAKGTPVCQTSGQAPDETSVRLGTGMVDFPGILKEAGPAGMKWYYIEDEHPEAASQIPGSIEYLREII